MVIESKVTSLLKYVVYFQITANTICNGERLSTYLLNLEGRKTSFTIPIPHCTGASATKQEKKWYTY